MAAILVGLIFIGLIVFLVFIIRGGILKGKIRNANYMSAKALYEKVLFDLKESPENSELRVKALELGREYYAYLHPDLVDFSKDERLLNFRDNSGVIEIKIQSDLNARTMKGKVS